MMGRGSVDHRSRETGRSVGRGSRLHTLALIAHDNKKVDLVAWATFNRAALSLFDLVATGTLWTLHTRRSARMSGSCGWALSGSTKKNTPPTTPVATIAAICASPP